MARFAAPETLEAKAKQDAIYVNEWRTALLVPILGAFVWFGLAKKTADRLLNYRIPALTTNRLGLRIFALLLPCTAIYLSDGKLWFTIAYKSVDKKTVAGYNFDQLKNRVLYNRLVLENDFFGKGHK